MDTTRPIIIQSQAGKKIFFCSDQHFGAPDKIQSKKREWMFINFLDSIKNHTQIIFLLGDLFDFWPEYQYVIPKGYIRVLGKLAELSDLGIQFYFFVGNHDLWMNDYLKKELGFSVLRKRDEFIINDKLFLIGHGDGLGPLDFRYKRMKKVFIHPLSRFLFRWIHPDFGIPIGNYLLRKNKLAFGERNTKFMGEENEWLIQYVKYKLKQKHYDYFIFGHRHLPLEISISNSIYFNLGDWIHHFTYLEYFNQKPKLKKWEVASII